MPLPADENMVEMSKGVLDAFGKIFGPHPGFRPAHAKGILLKGTFVPTKAAGELSIAHHFSAAEGTPVLVRFSNSTGIPQIPDGDANANPKGIAVRFNLPADSATGRRVHTDIVGHSTDNFPAATAEDALAFFTSIANGTIGEYIGSHPETLAFVTTPKPTPSGFNREAYFAVSAFKLVAADGTATFVRYRFLPVAGQDYLDDAALASKGPDFLFDAVKETVQTSGHPIEFKLMAQIAEDGAVTNNATVRWTSENIVELGTLTLDSLVDNDAEVQKTTIFDPVPRVPGVEPSDDPLLQLRAGVYLISGRDRRAAP